MSDTSAPQAVGTPKASERAAAALELRGISKRFGSVLANDRVDLTVAAGEVHALVGENGAGKTTLMNITFGLLQPDSGEIVIDGERSRVASPVVARRHGIGMVHQHFKLVGSLSVAENVFLGAEPVGRARSLSFKEMIRRVEEVSQRYELSIPARERIEWLSVGQRQRVEIIKALSFGAHVLILDEPTGVLTPQETTALFGILRAFADDGRSVILITHKLPEVMEVSDRFTVMRDGRDVAHGRTAEVTEAEIARLMVGRDVHLGRAASPPAATSAPPRVRITGLSALGDRGEPAVREVSLDLRPGEICGIAGVEGNGQTELVEALAGLRAAAGGRVILDGHDITRAGAAERRAVGISHIPEDRMATGVARSISLQENLAAGYLGTELFRHGLFNLGLARRFTRQLVRSYDVRGGGPSTPAGQLSGGNIQKLIVARELEARPSVLLAAQPTRGVDIGATEFVHDKLRAVRADGCAVLLVSADLSELLALADRIVVMYRGQTVAEFPPDPALVDQIGLAMAGGTAATPIGTPAAPGASALAGRTCTAQLDSPPGADIEHPGVGSIPFPMADSDEPAAAAASPVEVPLTATDEGRAAHDGAVAGPRLPDGQHGHHSTAGHGEPAGDSTPGRRDPARRRLTLSAEASTADAKRRDATTEWLPAARQMLGSLTQPASAVLLALVVGFIIILTIRQNPVQAYQYFLLGSFMGLGNFGSMLLQLTPLLLTGISVLVAFRAGIFNIGGEGQLYVGAFVGALVAFTFTSLPGPLLIVLSLACGGLAGAAWALIPAVLLAYWNVEIVVTTLMFSYVAQLLTAYLVNGPYRDPAAGAPETVNIAAKAELPAMLGTSGANIGVVIGLAAVAAVWLILTRTSWGLQLRLIGANRRFAAYAGVSVQRRVIEVMLVSGALAGIAGAVESLGVEYRFYQGFSPGFGFLGLTVALLGRLSPIGVVAAGFVYACLLNGANIMQVNTNVPYPLVDVLEGVIVVFMTAAGLIMFIRRRRQERPAPDTAPSGRAAKAHEPETGKAA